MTGPASIVEVPPGTFEIASRFGTRRLHQHLFVGRDGGALLLDADVAETPASVIEPALREIGVATADVRWLVVTHPDVDHQGGSLRRAARRARLPVRL